MPHIKITKTNRTYHDIDSTIASLFVEAGLAEYFTPVQIGSKPASRPTVPTFAVGLNNISNKFEIVLTLPGGGTARFSGNPREAKTAFKALAWNPSTQSETLQGPEPSAAVLAEYASAYGLPSAEVNAFLQSKARAEELQKQADHRALIASSNAARAGQ